MIRKIQHLRGTPEEYRAHDQVIPDGELALVRRKDGTVDIKVGDGSSLFSALPFVGRTVEESAGESILLRHNFEHRLGEVGRVEILLPDEIPEDFFSVLAFGSGLTGCSLSYPAERIVFVGDHTAGGVFYPEKRHHYAVSFYQRENLVGYVSAVGYELGDGLPKEVVETVALGSVLYSGKSEDLLDLVIDGKYESVDLYGEYYGIGGMDNEGTGLTLLLANKGVMTYDDFCEGMLGTYTSSSVKLTKGENEFSYYSKSTMASPFFTAKEYPFVENVSYHLHCIVKKRDCEPLVIGEFFDIGVRVVYTDGTAIAIRTPYTGGTDEEGNPMQTIDFFSDPTRKINMLGINYTPDGATNILCAEDFYFVAEDGTAEIPAPDTREVRIEIPAPLMSVGEIHDTLSLGSGIFTKRVHAQSSMSMTCTVVDNTTEYTIYRLQLLQKAMPHSPMFMWGFSNRKLEELPHFQKACCVDETGSYVYFTLTATASTITDYYDFSDERVPIPMYLLPEEESIEIEIPEIPFGDGFTAIGIKDEPAGKITLTHYV